jgi:hypothetical protein
MLNVVTIYEKLNSNHNQITVTPAYRSVPTTQPLPLFHHHSCHISRSVSCHDSVNVFSSVNVWKVFFVMLCPHSSVVLKDMSVHGPTTMHCYQLQHGASCDLHGMRLNDVTGVKTWGRLTMWQTWCPESLPKSAVEYRLFYKHCDASSQWLLVISNENFSLPVA